MLVLAIVPLAIGGALLWSLATSASALQADGEALSVTFQGERLSVDAQSVPRLDILSRISRLSGIALHLEAGFPESLSAEPITVAFSGKALDEALRRLLPGKNLVFVYAEGRLARVQFYGDAALPDGDPATTEPARVTSLVNQALGHAEARERLNALERLSELGDPAALRNTALTMLDRERDARVLDGALDVLAEVESISLEPLLRFFQTSQDAGLRLRALDILAERGRGDPRVLELLHTTTARAQDPELRQSARDLLSARPGE